MRTVGPPGGELTAIAIFVLGIGAALIAIGGWLMVLQ